MYDILVHELYSVTHTMGFGGLDVATEYMVMLHRIRDVFFPCASVFGLHVTLHFAANQCNRSPIEIKLTKKVSICCYIWSYMGGMQVIDC